MSDQPAAPPARPLTEDRGFWILIAYAVTLGVVGALAGLAFMGLTGAGNNWFDASGTGWFSGDWWWIAVTTGAGVVVGLLRHVTRLPDKTPGLIEDLAEAHVDYRLVPGTVLVSLASLIGGASLGPEKALGTIGGGAGSWVAERRKLSHEDSQVNTSSGFAGAFGGLFSAPLIVVLMIIEVARPGGRLLTKTGVAALVSSSVGFGVYFAIAGSVFLDAYPVPTYTFKDWYLLAGVGLGVFAAVVATLLGIAVNVSARLFEAATLPTTVRSTIGGAVFGLIGVALPLTMFTGSDELDTVIKDAGSLGVGLIVAIIVAKMVTFGVSVASGFVGGPIFPAIFIGGTAGILVNQVFPDVPVGLAFTCMLAAVPGSLVPAPFTMVLLASFLTNIGGLQTAPILIAVVTAFLVIQGVKYVMASRAARRSA